MEAPIESKICSKFSITTLTDMQTQAINALKLKKDVFIGTRTGSGKSLAYECAPILFTETSVTLILAPLKSIMKEQVIRLQSLGYRAVAIDTDTDKETVSSGYYHFVYGSPEMLVKDPTWRTSIRRPEFVKRIRLIVVDEAHTTVHWGHGRDGEAPFREWFAHIGELRSIFINVPIMALTATASPHHRRQIMKSLCFKPLSQVHVVVDSPDRPNIKLSTMMVKNSEELGDIFHWIIKGLHDLQEEFPRHLIFCDSIKNCSSIFMIFAKHFGKSDLFDMYHSKTTDAIKENIRVNMKNEFGKLRVLICTDAAGMGVNFSSVHNIVHYGPPRELDTLVQQMGRAGRDNVQSQELIIFKPIHLRRCDDDLITLLKATDECRRQILLKAYVSFSSEPIKQHNCCDICESKCACHGLDCPSTHPGKLDSCKTKDFEMEVKRQVSDTEKATIRQKLLNYRSNLSESSPSGILDSEVIHGFTLDVIDDVVNKSAYLTTVHDILGCTLVSSFEVSQKVLSVISEVFDDFDLNSLEFDEFEYDEGD